MINKSNKTSNNNTNETEEKCPVCTAYSYFEQLMKNNDIEDSFHDAAGYLIETIVYDVMDAVYEEGFEDGQASNTGNIEQAWLKGYSAACKSISEELAENTKTIENSIYEELNRGEHMCKDCDCESVEDCTESE